MVRIAFRTDQGLMPQLNRNLQQGLACLDGIGCTGVTQIMEFEILQTGALNEVFPTYVGVFPG